MSQVNHQDETPQLKRALAAIKELRARLEAVEQSRTEPIAIIGMGCRFPGGANSPEAYWALLKDGVDAIREVPSERWDVDALYDPNPLTPAKMNTRWGGFIDQVDHFDPYFFEISPREAEQMDPQQRLVLEVAWEALESAGQTREGLAGGRTGVFIGVHSHSNDYFMLHLEDPSKLDTFAGTGTAHNVIGGRLAYFLDLHGPNVVVDTACSSSLVATHLACQSLRMGECDLAIVGGVNLILSPGFSIAAAKMQMLAPDGRCKPFDAQANGFVRSEGCGIVVLKRLSDARREGDSVQAIIRGIAINQDGHTNGLAAPNGISQQAVIKQALENGKVDPGWISYIEAHGTGTALGDPIEVEALAAVFGGRQKGESPCWLGSAKANIGHLEGAAGVAGLIKAVLCLKNKEIPPLLHFKNLNPIISLENTPFVIPEALTSWRIDQTKRYAGVSSFGWSGTNAHVVLEEAPEDHSQEIEWTKGYLLPISAHSPEALKQLLESYRSLLSDPRRVNGRALYDICFTASLHRSHLGNRLALVGESREDLLEGIQNVLRDQTGQGIAVGKKIEEHLQGLVFVFPGQGAQWLGMGRGLYQQEPVFKEMIDRCDRVLRELQNENPGASPAWSVTGEITASAGESRLDEVDVVQPVLFAIQVALAELWRSWGLVPDAVVGHSMGEVAAAVFAGALSLEDGAKVIYHRSRLLRKVSGKGGMAVVGLSFEEAQQRIAGREAQLSVAVNNSPRSVVLSGEPAALQEVLDQLRAENVFCRLVKVDVASHSPQMDALCPELYLSLEGIHPQPSQIAIYSTVTGERLPGGEFGPSYWKQNLRQPVQFARVIANLSRSGNTDFIEISPHPILSISIQETLAKEGVAGQVISSLRRDQPERLTLLNGLGELFTRGYRVEWKKLYPFKGKVVSLPPVPWQHQRFWLQRPASQKSHARFGSEAVSRLTEGTFKDAEKRLYGLRWESIDTDTSAKPLVLPANWLILADKGGIGDALAKKLEGEGLSRILAYADKGYTLDGVNWLPLKPESLEDFQRLFLQLAERGMLENVGIVYLWGLDAPFTEQLSPCDLEESEVRMLGGALHLFRAMALSEWTSRPRVWLVTRGTQAVREGSEVQNVSQATLWGFGRAADKGHPEFQIKLVDLEPGLMVPEHAEQLFARILRVDSERLLALRAGQVYGLRLVPLREFGAEDRKPLRLRADGSYLITGGLGEVGIQLAHWLVEQGAHRLILVGRTKIPPRTEWARVEPNTPLAKKIEAIRSLERQGASVHLACIDIADEAQFNSFLTQYQDEQWPPILGVFHAAGVIEDRLIVQLDLESLRAVLRPKLIGSWLLNRLPNLEYFVMFSSLGAILGQLGQGNYAAANSFLDALAHSRHAKGLAALSVNWGVWSELGFSTSPGGQRTIHHLAEQGIHGFTPDEGLSALGLLLGQDVAQAAVMHLDIAQLRSFFQSNQQTGHQQDFQLFSYLLSKEELPTETAGPGSAQVSRIQESVLDQLHRAEPEKRRDLLETYILGKVAQVLKLEAWRIDPQKPLGALGFDSLLALEFRNQLEMDLGLILPATLIWNYPTIESLTDYLASKLGTVHVSGMSQMIHRHDVAAPKSEERGYRELDEVTDELQDLSDEEALKLLLKRRSQG